MDTQDKKLLQGIDTVIIRVKDIEVSKVWYQDKLGLKPLWNDPNMKLTVFDTNGPTSLTLWQTDREVIINKETSSYPIFKTADVTVLRKELKARGIEVGEVIEDDYVKLFFMYDPDGNVMEVCLVLD